MFWFDFEAVLFLENPKIRQPLRRIVKRGTKSNPIHNLKTKTLFKDIKISYTFSLTATGISMFHIIFADCSARSRVRALAVLL